MTHKALAIRAVRSMPEKATLEQISEELAILAGIERGRQDIAAGRFYTDEEVGRIIKTWFADSPGRDGRKNASKKPKTASPRTTRPRRRR